MKYVTVRMWHVPHGKKAEGWRTDKFYEPFFDDCTNQLNLFH